MEKITPAEVNLLVVQIEKAHRTLNNLWKARLRQINPSKIREIMRTDKIGLQCEKCLNKRDVERYCCHEHSDYYRSITANFYGTNYPFSIDVAPRDSEGYIQTLKVICPICAVEKNWGEMSIDHIVPITKGGLEFDRNNLQWMCLKCNQRKSNHTEEEIALRHKNEKAQQKLFDDDDGKGSVVVESPDLTGV